MDNNGEGGESTTIKLGEVEYTPDELQGLIDDGKFKREIEEKQNTKLDKLNSAFTKLTEERKTWETERQELTRLKEEKENASKKHDNLEFDETTIAKARAEAKALGIFTKDDVESYVNENFPKFYSQQRAGEKLLEQSEKLEKDIDGSDGRPKFQIEDVLLHMRETGIRDPFKAYKDKYEDELDKWKTAKLAGSKREGLLSEHSSSAGGKQPPEIRPNRTNLTDLFREALREGK